MASNRPWRKYPSEAKWYGIDYSPKCQGTDVPASVVSKAGSNGVVVEGGTIEGTIVKIRLSGGTPGMAKISCTVLTVNNETLEEVVTCQVLPG